ncbi:hypothetical protein [Haliangium sp.]|uniref:hypothetical protein n=1 Tax=Haliangium sp. TaxID=2663208 RepID=UPI003D0F19A2
MPAPVSTVRGDASARRAATIISLDPRDTVPLVPGELLGTEQHPFGCHYRPVPVDEIEAIAAMSDPVRRNLRITQAYHDLTASMTFLLGRRNVNWCAFATWASKTAGQFIRGDYLPELVQAYLTQVRGLHRGLHALHRTMSLGRRVSPGRGLGPLPGSLLVECIERAARMVAEHLAHGNLIVFAEIAPLFARMHDEFRGATRPDPAAIERFLSPLIPGPVSEGGQDLLAVAFRAYYQAMFEKDGKRKAELILLANDAIGLHEQTRLQHDIRCSLDAPIAALIMHATRERVRQLFPRRLVQTATAAVERTLAPFMTYLQRAWAVVATRWLMRMELPGGGMLLLGKDVDHPAIPGMFPTPLVRLTNPELRALLYELDFTPNTARGSAASDWGDLAQRMNFVVDFFRIYQRDGALLRAPYSPAQVDVIRGGGIPSGPL